MIRRYTLPIVTIGGQATSVVVLIDNDVEFRKWLSCVKRIVPVAHFDFRWSKHPRESSFRYCGRFSAVYKPGGIYIKLSLYYCDYYRDLEYPIDKFWRMIFKCTERPSFGLRITVKV